MDKKVTKFANFLQGNIAWTHTFFYCFTITIFLFETLEIARESDRLRRKRHLILMGFSWNFVMSLVVLHFSVFKQKYGSSTVYWEFEQNCEILNKITKIYEKHTKCVIFRKLPLDRKNSFLPKTNFIEIVCFLYWCLKKTKL